MRRMLFVLCVLALLGAGCGGEQGVDASVGDDAAVQTDAFTAVDAFSGTDAPGCGTSQWRDPATGACSDCPAAPIDCGAVTNPAYDATTHVFSFDLSGAEIVSGTTNIGLNVPAGTTDFDGVVGVDGAHVSGDYTATFPDAPDGASFVRFWLVDACGTSSPELYFTGTWGRDKGGVLQGMDFFCASS